MHRKGFTLIEIVTVAFIVGILAIMAIPGLTRMMNRSYANDAMHNLMAIYSAQKNYALNNGAFTTSLTPLELDIIMVGGMAYACDILGTPDICTATSGVSSGSFVMRISLEHPINSVTAPFYCTNLTTPNYTTRNPCCTAGGGAVNTRCP